MGVWLFYRESLKGAQEIRALTLDPSKILYIQVMFATLVGSTKVLPYGKLVIIVHIRLSVNMVLRSQVASMQKVLTLA